MLKRVGAPYRSGQSRDWIKTKNPKPRWRCPRQSMCLYILFSLHSNRVSAAAVSDAGKRDFGGGDRPAKRAFLLRPALEPDSARRTQPNLRYFAVSGKPTLGFELATTRLEIC